jgi:hypothetical protein
MIPDVRSIDQYTVDKISLKRKSSYAAANHSDTEEISDRALKVPFNMIFDALPDVISIRVFQ